jgi:hypothetical protein
MARRDPSLDTLLDLDGQVLVIDLCAEFSDVKQATNDHHPPTVLGPIECWRTPH